jgi:hypothetical protein
VSRIRARKLAPFFVAAIAVLGSLEPSHEASAQDQKPRPRLPAKPNPDAQPPKGATPKPLPIPIRKKGDAPPGDAKKGDAKKADRPAKPAKPPRATEPAKSSDEDLSMRWTGATPDDTIDLALRRAKGGGVDAVAGLLVAAAMHSDVAPERVPKAFADIGRGASFVADDARWLARLIGPRPPGKPWAGLAKSAPDAPLDRDGLVENLAILGPFQDTGGGGVNRREGPEAPGQLWGDAAADYSWGAFEVRWRRAIPDTVSARGIPLDLYISPRDESCTYLGTAVTVPAGGADTIVVNVASTGAIRLVWDGVSVGTSEELHTSMLLDRMSVAIEGAAQGTHLLGLKVCTSSVADHGRARLRFTDGKGAALALRTSSDLSSLVEYPSEAPPATAPAAKNAPPAAKAPGAPPQNAKPPQDAKPPQQKATPPSKSAPPKEAPKGGKAAPPKSAAAPGPVKAAAPAPKKPAARTWTSRRIPTALERAVQAGDDGRPGLAIVAAVARTLGGADHAQSPRAPGLLDRIARSGANSDQLAMAGWLSPFGSNKSGWLNQARALAKTEGDSGAEAFAQRVLVASSLAGAMSDWAVGAAHEEPLASSKDAAGQHLKAVVDMRSGGTGTSQATLEKLMAIDRTTKGGGGLSMWRDIQRAARGDADLQLKAAQRLASMGQPRDPAYVRAHLIEGPESVERAVAFAVRDQRSSGDLVAMGRELLRLGRVAWAREILSLAVYVGPNDAEAFAALAETLRSGSPRDGARAASDRAAADGALRRVLALRPGDARAKAEAVARSGRQNDEGRSGAPDEKWLAAPEAFLARKQAQPAKKGQVYSRQLHWVRAVTLHPDKRVSQLIHYAREIVIEPRTQAETYERDIPEEGDDTELLIARVHRKDGTVAEPEERGGGQRAFVRWPDLHEGDVVEVAVRQWSGPIGRRGDPPFYFIDYVGSNDANPVLYNEVVVDSPAAAPLAVEVLNGKADRATETREGDRVVSRYIWDNPPALPDEPFAPRSGEVLPLVVGSDYRSWEDFLVWYRGATRGFVEPDDQIRRLSAELTKGKKSRDEKVEALFDFVADDIRYVNYVSGEWWLPNRPQQLLARRQGDCDDKAMLLVSLLRAAGIEAQTVLVQTRHTAMPSIFSGQKAAVPMFDHGIAFLPGENGGKGRFLDATSPQSRMGVLPSMDARARALMVDGKGPPKIIETPPSSPADHGVSAEWTVSLEPTGAAAVTAVEQHRGDSAFELRMALSEADARGQWVERYLQARLPTVDIDPAKIDFDPKKGRLAFAARSAGVGRLEGDEIAVPLAGARTYTTSLAPLPPARRTLPVVLPPGLAPSQQRYRTTIVAPKGYRFAELPPGGKVDGGDLGRASLEVKPGAAANTVFVDLDVVIDKSTIPLAQYPAFRQMLQRIDALTHRVVRLVPDGTAPAAKTPTPEPKQAGPKKAAPLPPGIKLPPKPSVPAKPDAAKPLPPNPGTPPSKDTKKPAPAPKAP